MGFFIFFILKIILGYHHIYLFIYLNGEIGVDGIIIFLPKGRSNMPKTRNVDFEEIRFQLFFGITLKFMNPIKYINLHEFQKIRTLLNKKHQI